MDIRRTVPGNVPTSKSVSSLLLVVTKNQRPLVLYQRDAPGHALATRRYPVTRASNLGNASDIVYTLVDALTVGTDNSIANNNFSVSQNYSGTRRTDRTSINITLKKASSINFTVADILGKSSLHRATRQPCCRRVSHRYPEHRFLETWCLHLHGTARPTTL